MRTVKLFPMCSFCGKGKQKEGSIIVGDKSCICDECVDVCMEIVNEDRALKKKHEGNKTDRSTSTQKEKE